MLFNLKTVHNTYISKILPLSLALCCLLSVFGSVAQAKILFEGYYKLLIGQKHAGYVIQRYEFLDKSKNFKSTYFVQSDPSVAKLTESLTAHANQKYQPISYQYTSSNNGQIKIIDASFKGQKAKMSVSTDGKRANSSNKTIKSGTFLSTFLGYLMLSEGITADRKFNYNAMAEEDGEVYSGEAYIKKEALYNGHKAYKVLNVFKGTKFISYMSKKGEVLGTHSPLQQVKTELVKNSAEAIKNFPYPKKSLKIVFGKIPTGKTNLLWKKEKPTNQPAAKPTQHPKTKKSSN